MTRHAALQRELMEEALCYLAKLEAESPSRDSDFYLERCRRHLANFRYLARSWEAPKVPKSIQDAATSGKRHARTPDEERRFGQVVSALEQHLSRREIKVLTALSEGRTAEEIAVLLRMPVVTIVEAQRKIAALILRLGLAPRAERPPRKRRLKRARTAGRRSRPTPPETRTSMTALRKPAIRARGAGAQVSPS